MNSVISAAIHANIYYSSLHDPPQYGIIWMKLGVNNVRRSLSLLSSTEPLCSEYNNEYSIKCLSKKTKITQKSE